MAAGIPEMECLLQLPHKREEIAKAINESKQSNGLYYYFFEGLKWIPALPLIMLVSWTYFVYTFELCMETIKTAPKRMMYLIIYHIVLFMLLWSYWQTLFKRTLKIPEEFKVSDEDFQIYINTEDSKNLKNQLLENLAVGLPLLTTTIEGHIRFCEKCRHFKPDRTHHCSTCGICHLKMDHHCPWINKCISFSNYKFFVLLLGYGLLYFTYITATTFPFFLEVLQGEAVDEHKEPQIYLLFYAALLLDIGLVSLFAYNCYLLLTNVTTLEAMRPSCFREYGVDKYGFSIGRKNNFFEVFGTNPMLWLLPVSSSLGNGVEFPVSRRHWGLLGDDA